MLRPLLVSSSLNLIFEDTEEIPALYTDEGKVSQILRNFISNALKFTEAGEVRVSAEVESGDGGDGLVVFRVRDTGIGIAQADQETIFQEFAQLDSALQRKVKGTGLGLPLSKKLAELLGGSVGVESELGRGIHFLAADSEDLPGGGGSAGGDSGESGSLPTAGAAGGRPFRDAPDL